MYIKEFMRQKKNYYIRKSKYFPHTVPFGHTFYGFSPRCVGTLCTFTNNICRGETHLRLEPRDERVVGKRDSQEIASVGSFYSSRIHLR